MKGNKSFLIFTLLCATVLFQDTDACLRSLAKIGAGAAKAGKVAVKAVKAIKAGKNLEEGTRVIDGMEAVHGHMMDGQEQMDLNDPSLDDEFAPESTLKTVLQETTSTYESSTATYESSTAMLPEAKPRVSSIHKKPSIKAQSGVKTKSTPPNAKVPETKSRKPTTPDSSDTSIKDKTSQNKGNKEQQPEKKGNENKPEVVETMGGSATTVTTNSTKSNSGSGNSKVTSKSNSTVVKKNSDEPAITSGSKIDRNEKLDNEYVNPGVFTNQNRNDKGTNGQFFNKTKDWLNGLTLMEKILGSFLTFFGTVITSLLSCKFCKCGKCRQNMPASNAAPNPEYPMSRLPSQGMVTLNLNVGGIGSMTPASTAL